MTVSTEVARNDYIGTGATATFDFDFQIYDETDLLVTTTVTATGALTELSYPADYSVTGVGEPAGGQIVLTGGNLAAGETLSVRFRTTLTQETDLRNQGGYHPESVEDALDRLVKIDQQQQDEIDRTLMAAAGDFPGALPSAVDRANKYLGFDALGNPGAYDPAGGAISSAANVNFLPVLTGAASITVAAALLNVISPLNFGAIGNDVADDAVPVQEAFTHIRDNGGYLWGGPGGRTYRVSAGITCQRTSALHAKRWIFDFSGNTISAPAVVAGAILNVGADSQANFAENGEIVIKNIRLVGNELSSPVTIPAIAPAGSLVGLKLDYAANVTLGEGIRIESCRTGIQTRFVFPLTSIGPTFVNYCGVVLLQQDASNAQVWNALNGTTCRYFWCGQPNTGLGFGINDLTFINPRVESCVVGFECDPSNNANDWLKGFKVEGGFFATITSDVYRFGKMHAFADPVTRGADQLGEMYGIYIDGGHYSYTFAGAAAPLVFSATGTVKNVHVRGPIQADHLVGIINQGVIEAGHNVNYPAIDPHIVTYGKYSGGAQTYHRMNLGANVAVMANATSAAGLFRFRRDQSATTLGEVENQSANAAACAEYQAANSANNVAMGIASTGAATPSKGYVKNRANAPLYLGTNNVDRGGYTGGGAWVEVQGYVAMPDLDTTPSVAGGRLFVFAYSAITTVTTLDDGVEGQIVECHFDNANVQFANGATMKLQGGVNFVSSANDVMVLRKRNGVWIERNRSVN